ncbi:MAG TPA: multicopper oxidase domain-containing protein [Actinomycetota bacterium]|nr:multicopper oxidase domain-containing protein [Actinomycetota bacterium]
MGDRTRFSLFGAFAGFMVVVAFGAGIIVTSAFDSTNPFGGRTTAAAGSAETLRVELGDLFIKPAKLSAPAGPITIEVHNGGGTQHNFSVDKLGATPMLDPGQSYTLDLGDVAAGTYEYICQVPGHADSGMRGTLTVTGGSGGGSDQGTSGGSSGGAGGMSGMSPAEMAKMDAAVTAKFPAETKGKGGRLLEPKVLADGTKRYDLTASVIDWETEPGKVQKAWAYNGMVPGPTIEPNLGDKVQIVLHNKLPEPTTIHFHGMTVPADMDGVPAISQDAVLPGDSFTYEFTIRNTGTNMYHSHFDAQNQVPNGLLGAFIVPDPKDPKVDVDYNMVLNDGPLGFTLNGKGFPATQPLAVQQGDTVRIRYMNEGLQIHPMHLHGLPQKVIALDGHLLRHPYDADTVMVAPGQRVDVLVQATEPGAWAWHCHILTHAESSNGMFGMVTAMIVQ